MSDDGERVIVSVANRPYLWGLYLLIASLRRFGMGDRIHAVCAEFTDGDADLIAQFSGVRVIPLAQPERFRGMYTTAKAEALLTARGAGRIVWIDSDCMVNGDISRRLEHAPGELMIRLRTREQNFYRFNHLPDATEGIPQSVLDIWRRDVGEREEPLLGTSCVGNVFSFSNEHWPLVEQYRNQIEEILDRHLVGDDTIRHAYRFSHGSGVSDELTLSSLLNFSRHAPPIAPFTLDQDPQALLIHLSLRPKPWEAWSARAMRYYELIVSTVEWARQGGFDTPPVPWQFERNRRVAAQAQCYFVSVRTSARAFLTRRIRAIRRRRSK